MDTLKHNGEDAQIKFTSQIISKIETKLGKIIPDLGKKSYDENGAMTHIVYSIEEIATCIQFGMNVNEEDSFKIIDNNSGCGAVVMSALMNSYAAIYAVAKEGN